MTRWPGALEKMAWLAYETRMSTAQEVAQKRFDEEDKVWTGPKYIRLGLVTLLIAISTIYYMSTTAGCSLQIVP